MRSCKILPCDSGAKCDAHRRKRPSKPTTVSEVVDKVVRAGAGGNGATSPICTTSGDVHPESPGRTSSWGPYRTATNTSWDGPRLAKGVELGDRWSMAAGNK